MSSREHISALHRRSGELYRQRQYEGAIECNKQLIALIEREEGPNSSELGSPLNNLAMLCEKRGEDVQAEDLFKRSLKVMRSDRNRGHHLGRTHRSLGKLYARQGRAKEAEGHLRDAREVGAGAVPTVPIPRAEEAHCRCDPALIELQHLLARGLDRANQIKFIVVAPQPVATFIED